MGEVGVDGSTDDLAVDGIEFTRGVTEGGNLSWADESEVKWPEEEDDILS